MTTTTSARARKGDPGTSWESARTVEVGNTRERVLSLLIAAGDDGITHDRLIALHRRKHALVPEWPEASDQSIRSRCAELVEDGQAEAVPDSYATTVYGRRMRRWRAVPVQNYETDGQGVGR